MQQVNLKCYWLMAVLILMALGAEAQLSKSINIGYIDRFEKLPKIILKQSSQSEFDKTPSTIEPAKIKIQEGKTHFTLQTKAKKITLKKTNQDQADFDGYEYLGYFPKLKMYAITENTMSDNLSFGSFGLIDSLTSYFYNIISIGDGAVETPIPSVNSKYLIYYYNRLYDGDSCFIGLIEVNRNNKPSRLLKEKLSLETDDFAIENIKWIEDKTFMVKTFSTKIEDGKVMKTYNYFKANIE